MRMSNRLPHILRAWAMLGGALALLHGALFVAWNALQPSTKTSRDIVPIVGLMVIYTLLFGVIVLWFTIRLGNVTQPKAYRDAQRNGQPAQARVDRIERTRWRIERNRNLRLRTRPRRTEYVMRIWVMSTPPYEAEIAAFLSADHAPDVGAIIPVKIHPEQPSVIVLDEALFPPTNR
ncbi:MAG TPA: hypothetical protein PLD47_03785 [Aggregatilineales bacterium]|nr:hypothetical protein [Anaerolineales bacterium]HRE46822.1 hypothetical protein [Aggregatilineales bacterium]